MATVVMVCELGQLEYWGPNAPSGRIFQQQARPNSKDEWVMSLFSVTCAG